MEVRNHADIALQRAIELNVGLACLIADLMMPLPNGWEDPEAAEGLLTGLVLAKRVREIIRNVPVIFVTAHIHLPAGVVTFATPVETLMKHRLTDKAPFDAVARLVGTRNSGY